MIEYLGRNCIKCAIKESDPDTILDYMESLIEDDEQYYILLDEVQMYPLTFKEFMEAYDGDMYRGWAEYVVYGGLPLTVTMKTEEQKIHWHTVEILFRRCGT